MLSQPLFLVSRGSVLYIPCACSVSPAPNSGHYASWTNDHGPLSETWWLCEAIIALWFWSTDLCVSPQYVPHCLVYCSFVVSLEIREYISSCSYGLGIWESFITTWILWLTLYISRVLLGTFIVWKSCMYMLWIINVGSHGPQHVWESQSTSF